MRPREALPLADGVETLLFDAKAGEANGIACSAYRLSYAVIGEARHRRWKDGQAIVAGALPSRSVSLIEPGVTPRSVVGRHVRLLHVCLPEATLKARAEVLGLHPLGLELVDPLFRADAVLDALFSWLAEALASPAPSAALTAQIAGEAIVARFLQSWSNRSPQPLRAEGGLAAGPLRRVCDAMSDRLADDLSLADLAALAGLSPSYFSRAFKQATGVSPLKWREERRLERAKALLLRGDLSLAEVALSVGFSAQPQFTTAFRRLTGSTPGRWRRANS
ncbi:MAG: helix-turn-helix transcriptional regulator [Methylobacteriaceae bacterium]|nr:helix-turn-helix transcriptional regulator [Methylobacteriaceae bacterium]